MFTDDEKDYIMRMIKELPVSLPASCLGKKYVQVELPVESKYQISGDKLWRRPFSEHNYSPGGNMGWDPAAGRRCWIWKYYKYA